MTSVLLINFKDWDGLNKDNFAMKSYACLSNGLTTEYNFSCYIILVSLQKYDTKICSVSWMCVTNRNLLKILKSAIFIKNMSIFVPKKTYLKLKFACLEHEKPHKFLTLKYYLSRNVVPWYGLWCFHCTLLVFSRQCGWLA